MTGCRVRRRAHRLKAVSYAWRWHCTSNARRSYMTRSTGTAAMVLFLALSSGCVEARHGRPVIGGSVVANPTGTIAGTVTNSAGTPLEGRRVTAIDVTSEQHYDAVTAK